MRHLRQLLLGIGLATAVAAPVVVSTDAHADARSDAKAHYQAGVKAYNAADYKGAIKEFSAAQSLVPADLNNYNLALCYDKLGDPEPAVQYYKAYLDKVPGTDKRAEIEASIQRLDAAAKSIAAKRAEEDRKAEEARKQIEAKRQADEAAAAKKRADEEAALAKKKADEEAARKRDEEARNNPPIGPAPPGTPGVSSTGSPGTGVVAPTGDPQLDRVNGINIDQIRDQRVGAATSGIPDRRTTPGRTEPSRVGVGGGAGGGDPVADQRQQPPPQTATAGTERTPPAADPATPTDKPKQTPVYKKWWFWAVVAVSAYVVYNIATDDSKSSSARTMLPTPGVGPQPSGGATLFRF